MSQTAPMSALPLFAAPAAREERPAAPPELSERREYLEAIRSRMRMLYRSRAGIHGSDRARVTPDDARYAFESMNPPAGISRNFLAHVFREPGWVVVGEYESATNGAHRNKLQAYAWRGE